jgi:hypothetical protein
MIEVTADAVRVAIAADRSEAAKLPGNKMGCSQPIERYLLHAGNADGLGLKTVTKRKPEIIQEIGAEPMNPSRPRGQNTRHTRNSIPGGRAFGRH